MSGITDFFCQVCGNDKQVRIHSNVTGTGERTMTLSEHSQDYREQPIIECWCSRCGIMYQPRPE